MGKTISLCSFFSPSSFSFIFSSPVFPSFLDPFKVRHSHHRVQAGLTLDRASGRTVRRIATTPSNKNNAAPKSASPHQAYAGEGTMAPQPGTARQQSATWAEKWFLQWTPESEIELVEAVLLGETVELATAYKFKSLLESCTSIADAAALVHDACQCGLMKSMELARRRLQELAATSSEFAALASAA